MDSKTMTLIERIALELMESGRNLAEAWREAISRVLSQPVSA